MYQHALEAELARTIAHMGAVRDARVHLALPRQSSFIRDRKSASASVMVDLYRGQELSSDQVASVVNLVASSVPDLLAADITVIDQQGRLLSAGDERWNDLSTSNQFKLAERQERIYKRRIEDLLTPIMGPGRVRAEVVVDMDFTVSEETRESFDPAGSVVVSEHVSQSRRTSDMPAPRGVPGALSNQPPGSGDTAETQNAAGEIAADSDTSNSSTRNFEVDRTVSHTRPQTGVIRRLSIAVLVDESSRTGGEDAAALALTDADIEQFSTLIKEAVGFDESRGDTVAVVKSAFLPVPEAAPMEAPPFWKNSAVINAVKQGLGVLLVLVLAFGLVRPLLKNLIAPKRRSAGCRERSAAAWWYCGGVSWL